MATNIDLNKCNLNFALDLFRELASIKKAENVLFSPYSVSNALAMTSLGARNETLKQMREALRLEDISEEQTHEMFSELNKSILKENSQCTLLLANRLYGEMSHDFKEEFLGDSGKFYGAELAAVDFKNETAACVKEINEWVATQTKDRIVDLIQSGSVDNTTKLILVNALYFKGEWIKKFKAKNTEESDFRVNDDLSVKVQMMHLWREWMTYGFNDKLHCQILELPYCGRSVSMIILLPDLKLTTLEELENSLTSEDLNNLNVKSTQVNLSLPKFKVEQDFELSDQLKQLGVTDAFGEKADFSGMTGTLDLQIGKVVHKTFIEVNEYGTEAAAATAVQMLMGCCLSHAEPVEFKADHPFLYLLRDNNTNSILFLGRLVQP